MIAAQRLHTAVHSPEQLAALEQSRSPRAGDRVDEAGYRHASLRVRPEEAEAFYQRLSQCKTSASR